METDITSSEPEANPTHTTNTSFIIPKRTKGKNLDVSFYSLIDSQQTRS